MNRAEREQQAVSAVLQPLADYVMQMGVNKRLDDYNKAEIIGLVETVLQAYHSRLQAFYEESC